MAESRLDYLTCEPFRAWNRLEPRPRTAEFDRALQAEIHDPLWMLTRQWQFGEFKGEDTGSAVFAKVLMETTRVTKFQTQSQDVQPYEEEIPLEALIERMTPTYDLTLRVRAGQIWLKILNAHGESYNGSSPAVPYVPNSLKLAYVTHFGFSLPEIDPENDRTDVQVAKAKLLSNKAAHQALSAHAGRSIDGVVCYQQFVKAPAQVPSSISSDPSYRAAFKNFVLDAMGEFIQWFQESHELPASEEDRSWKGENLEYSFSCSVPNAPGTSNTLLRAQEYYHGRLDWYAFDHDLDVSQSDLGVEDPLDQSQHVNREVLSFIPAEARFGGMPNSRWWEFEDGATDFGSLNAETTHIAKILFAEFALMYSNDWFVIPYTLRAGSISEVKGMVITDTFGERTYVEAAAQGDSNDWTAWTLYNLSKTANSEGLNGKVDPRVFIPPTVSKVQESDALESVIMLRDEMANMVWGIEEVIPDLIGGGQDGHAAANTFNQYLKQVLNNSPAIPTEIPEGVKLRYNLGNEVPENWIPFLPTHLPGQSRAIQLQRASLPRWFNQEFNSIRPRTAILREGMDNATKSGSHIFVHPNQENQLQPYYIYEEEVPRAGVIIQASWQRTRWYDGKTVCWYGRRKITARGEGASGLAYDQVLHVDYENQEALVKETS